MKLLPKDVQRFESKFTKGEADECWEWKAGGLSSGYGEIMVNGKLWTSHRLSYSIYVGEITDGLHVLHSCDNPGCVNPAHLFLGTNLDNIRDMNSKGRQSAARGENGSHVTLTEAAVREIRKRYRRWNHNKSNCAQLAAEFGVKKSCIHHVLQGRNWRHLL